MKIVLPLFTVFIFTFSGFSQDKTGSENLIDTEMYSGILAENRRMIVHLPVNYFERTVEKILR